MKRASALPGLLATLAGILAAGDALAIEPRGCPRIAGHYRIAQFGDTTGEALEVMQARMAGFTGSEIRLELDLSGLNIWIRSGASGSMPKAPSVVLRQDADFTCRDGWVEFRRTAAAGRRHNGEWLEGSSRVRIAPHAQGGLNVQLHFSGGRRNTIYSYDSARVSIPVPGTGVTLPETVRWPDIAEPAAPERASAARPVEPVEVRRTRAALNDGILGGVVLAASEIRGDALRVTLKAPRSEDVIRMEDRMRAAGIGYEFKSGPTWSERSYHIEMLVWPEGGARPWRPSRLRVEHELNRLRHAATDLVETIASDDTYIVTLRLRDQVTVESVAERLRSQSTMFSSVEVLPAIERPDMPNARTARLRLRLPGAPVPASVR